ncbi:MAG: GlsB/YeaQ/YmgE family stress response membrane protein [Planctomycetota bacterium]
MQEFLVDICVGLIAGWLAGMLMQGGGYGLVGDIIVGVFGALIGGFLFRSLGINESLGLNAMGGGLPSRIGVATVGAVALILVLKLIKRI